MSDMMQEISDTLTQFRLCNFFISVASLKFNPFTFSIALFTMCIIFFTALATFEC